MNVQEWVVKGLVVVKYPKDDFMGMILGYYSLLVYQIQAVYITLFLRNRDLLTFWCCFTHMISEILNYILKHLLKEPRPDGGPPSSTVGLFEGHYGMPSQHCHCFGYLTAMVFLLVFHYYKGHISKLNKFLVASIFPICLFLQVYARIYLKFHSARQCIIGVLFGFTSASIFYLIGLKFFLPYSEQICRLIPLKLYSFKRDLVPSKRIKVS